MQRVSPSKLGAYEACPLRYKYSYIDGLLGDVGPAMQAGEWTHKAIEAWMRGKDDPWPEILPFVSPANKESVETLGAAREYFASFLEWTRENSYLRSGIAPGESEVEFNFVQKIPGAEVEFNGFIDLLLPSAVIEFKTTASADAWTQERADTSPQTFIYARAALDMVGEWVPVIHVILQKRKKFSQLVSKVTKGSYERFARDRVAALVGAAEFPANATPACFYCPYRSICPSRYKPVGK